MNFCKHGTIFLNPFPGWGRPVHVYRKWRSRPLRQQENGRTVMWSDPHTNEQVCCDHFMGENQIGIYVHYF